MAKTRKALLKEQLRELKKLADEQNFHYLRSRELLYKILSRTYIWWREANKETGLLDSLYKEHGIQYKREINADINFSPLLRYLWSLDGTIDSNTIDQWNRATNKLHIAYEGNKEYYRANTEVKLINFIVVSGGITKLAAYTNTFVDDADDTKQRKKKVDINLEKKRTAEHISNGRKYFATQQKYLATFQTSRTIPTADGDIGVGVIKRTRTGYALLDLVDDKDVINDIIVKAYTRDTKDVPFTIRFLSEVLSTQVIPFEMRKIARSLNEKTKYKNTNNEPVHRLRRLLFMAKERVFVLSSSRGSCSVVTLAYPMSSIMKATENTYLAVNDRNFIEDEILYAGDINFYKTDHPNALQAVKDESATHKLLLEHSVTNRSRYIRFYPISSYKDDTSKEQSHLKRGIKLRPSYTARVDGEWLFELNGKFISRWINGYGRAIKRQEYSVMRLSFGKTGITFQFIQRGGSYDDSEVISFASAVDSKPISVEVLSKDIIPVLKFLVSSELNGQVAIEVESKIIIFKFATNIAKYHIYLPTCTHKGKRQEDYFQAYKG